MSKQCGRVAKATADVVFRFRSHYIQELLLATTHEISQIVINEPPVAAPEPVNIDESTEQHGAEAVFVDDAPVGAEATMKKSFIRKKEIPSADDAKKKSKVARK